MLIGFEKITEDLTDFEQRQALPLIVGGLRSKLGKERAITGTEICRKVNESGRLGSYKLTSVKLRKMISYIRCNNLLSGVLSSSRGYYVANSQEEYYNCLESLKQRLRQQELAVDALTYQMNNHGKEA